MKLMIGIDKSPHLLVSVDDNYDPTDFNFHVENGLWSGRFKNGYISTLGCPGGDYTNLTQYQILTDNQDRLRGDYNVVFLMFSDENYIAPIYKSSFALFDDLEDNIPF